MRFLSRERHTAALADRADERHVRGPWELRLGDVGVALDALDGDLKDVALCTTGDDVLVSLLVCRTGRYHGVWTPTTVLIRGREGTPVRFGRPGTSELVPRQDVVAVVAQTAQDQWKLRLERLGERIDRTGAAGQELTAVEVDGGFVVTIQERGPAGRLGLRTLEITAESRPGIA